MIEAQQEIHRSKLSISNGIHTELSAVVGYRVVTASDGLSALNLVTEHNPDLLLLSDPLPVMDTYSVVTRIREFSSVPIMVLSSHPDGDHAAYMLEAGVDDYLVRGKFGDEELVARAGALLRRVYVYPGQYLSGKRRLPILTNGELTIDQSQRLVMLSGEEVPLTQVEYRLLACLARNVGKTMFYEDIRSEVWGSGLEYYTWRSDGKRMVCVNMARLRAKLGENSLDPRLIVTYPGIGYMMYFTTDEIELSIGPIDYKGLEDEVYPYSISRAKLAEDVVLTDDLRLNVSGRKRQIINIVRSLPDGMAVFRKSVAAALGISVDIVRRCIYNTRVFLQGSDYTIENVTEDAYPNIPECRYYWKKIE